RSKPLQISSVRRCALHQRSRCQRQKTRYPMVLHKYCDWRITTPRTGSCNVCGIFYWSAASFGTLAGIRDAACETRRPSLRVSFFSKVMFDARDDASKIHSPSRMQDEASLKECV